MFVENPTSAQDEEDQKKSINTPTVGAGGGASTSVGGTSMPATGNFSTTTPVQGQQPVQQWATAQDYLRANQPQADVLGSKVQESLTGTLESGKKAIETGAEEATKAIQAGTTPYNEALVSEAKTTPTSVTSDPGKLQSFLNQWNASYQGPESFETTESYTPAAQATQLGQTRAAQLGSTGGREQLLGEQFGIYGAGNKGLDQAILQQAPQYGQIQELAPQFANLKDYLSQQAAGINAAATAGKATTEGVKAKTQGAFAGKLTDFQNKLNAETQAAQQKAQTIADKYSVDISSGDPDRVAADLKEVGASDKDIKAVKMMLARLQKNNQILGTRTAIPPTQVYNFNPAVDINAGNVATPEEYANAAALQKLTGVDYSGILNPANAAQAGTADVLKSGINPQTLQDYLTPILATQSTDVYKKDADLLGTLNIGQADSDGYPATADGGMQALLKYPEEMQKLINTLERTRDPRYQDALAAATRQGFRLTQNTPPPPTNGGGRVSI